MKIGWELTEKSAKSFTTVIVNPTIVVYSLLDYQVQSVLFGMNLVFKHQDFQMFDFKLNEYE